MTVTGLKKCQPTTRLGTWHEAAMAVTLSDEVLVARTAVDFTMGSRAANSACLASSCSTIASITRSQSARAEMSSAGVNSMGDFGPRSDPTRMFVRECRGANMVDANGVAFEDPTCPANGSWLQNGFLGRYSLGVQIGRAHV